MPKTRVTKQDKPATLIHRSYYVFGLDASAHRVKTDDQTMIASTYQVGVGDKAQEIYSNPPIKINVTFGKGKKGKRDKFDLSSMLALQNVLITGICLAEVPHKQTSERTTLNGISLSNMERLHPRHFQLIDNGNMVKYYNRETHIFDRPRVHEGEHADHNGSGVFVLQLAA